MKLRTLKRRQNMLTLRNAVNCSAGWRRWNHRRSINLAWKMRQKWKDAPRCTVLRLANEGTR